MQNFVNVAFSGSGQCYPCFLGVLLCLEDNGIKIAEMSGTSGGSIVTAAFGSGLNPRHQMIDLLKKTLPFRNWLFDPSLSTLFKRWGLFKGDKIEAVLKEKFCPTLGESKIPIYITGTNLTKRRVIVYSSKANPEMSTALAVRASISIPIAFAPANVDGDIVIDGGWGKNYPLSVFDNGLPTLGFKFGRKGIFGKISGFFSFLKSMFETMIAGNELEDEEDAKNAATIHIATNYHAFNFLIGEKDVDEMINDGYESTQNWIIENYTKLFGETAQEIVNAEESVFATTDPSL